MLDPTSLVLNGAAIVIAPLRPYLIAGAIGVPLGLAVCNALATSFVKEEVRSGQLVSSWFAQGGPAQALRKLLTCGRIFGLGMVMAPLLTLTSKLILVSALGFGVMCSLLLGFLPLAN